MITTIILTVSREEFLHHVLSGLELLDCDNTYTNLLCIVDGDANLFLKVRNLVQDTKFNDRLTVQFNEKGSVKKYDVVARRNRITKIHNFAKQYVNKADYVLLTEDDTVIPPNALNALREALNGVRGAVFAEGVEVGRWGIPYIGAWKYNDIYNPTSVTSLEYKSSGIEEIDAGGFYCSLIKADVYLNHEFHVYESLGPDISMGLELRQMGYKLLVNWSVPCKHFNTRMKQVEVITPSENTKSITIKRIHDNRWDIKY